MFFRFLKVFIVAMLPLVELRLAIPISQAMHLPVIPSYIVAIIGNMLPVPFIYYFARRVLEWGAAQTRASKFFRYFLEKGEAAGAKLEAKAGRGLFFALMLFVAIPLPGTGAWTGTLGASILDMDFKKTCLACMSGVLCSGLLMMAISHLIFHTL
ncbi:MAG: small multi-drug export protein [Eubacteriales bacterium]|nr:small multi-drug export protein [Eubacteriales bacterium]